MTELKKVLMDCNEMTSQEADEVIAELNDRLINDGEYPQEVLMSVGLEEDYIFDLLY